ncbi:unnamed protein product [Cylicocyclus nassatus]|uniref:Uncharacterized protein n=1 Tax=Cylicocyclus nassatus TaxID=53992 RepID=A0AA36DRW3_CYLNA|nr:unnamed protein product [Cylicocyclus nassatus]
MNKIKIVLILMAVLFNGVGAQFGNYGVYPTRETSKSPGQIPHGPGASGMIGVGANTIGNILRSMGLGKHLVNSYISSKKRGKI